MKTDLKEAVYLDSLGQQTRHLINRFVGVFHGFETVKMWAQEYALVNQMAGQN